MPDLEEDEETDERAPLVAARPEPAPPAWREIRAMLWLLRWVLLLALLNTCLMRTGSVAYFPYLRTLQYCDTPANPAATHTSDWSGSDHCGDLKLVTREAQAIVGLGRGVGLVAHCVSMPFLGRLGDTVGRRMLLIIHFVGMLLESMINAANPSVPVFVLGCALRGSMVNVQQSWRRPSSAPAPPQGAPGGSGQPGTPRKRPDHWVPSHCLGCSSQPPPKSPISPPLTL